MSNVFKGFLVVGAGLVVSMVVLAISFLMYIYSVKKEEISLRNQAEAQQSVVLLAHDKMWKVLANKARITKEYSPEEKIKMLEEVVQGRTGGTFAKSVQEVDPNFDLSLLKDFSQSVEAEYAMVVDEQKKLLSLVNTHKNVVQDPLKSMIVSDNSLIVPKLITSTKSKEALETGVDDDVNYLDNVEKK